MTSFILLAFLWLLAIYTWRKYMIMCLCTDLADITNSYMSACGSCFWVAESGGQVVGIVGALPVKNPRLQKKKLQLYHLSMALEHRGSASFQDLLQLDVECSPAVIESVDILICQQLKVCVHSSMDGTPLGAQEYQHLMEMKDHWEPKVTTTTSRYRITVIQDYWNSDRENELLLAQRHKHSNRDV
ncbi:Hypothetical predicted protein [Marmota monax]|uniref:Uncharacterized protein n=1 Tax=Marmota monax TaxID=9995 RepID=A0A5E4D272_MARMO|nr:hypothetical protein GHT09_000325 [Marmota monax]VTJ88264.1 Hypothetical predicted protein [Marmota monax]